MSAPPTGVEPIFAVAYKRRYLKGQNRWVYQYVVDSAAQELIDRYGVDPEGIENAIDLVLGKQYPPICPPFYPPILIIKVKKSIFYGVFFYLRRSLIARSKFSKFG